jgi:hypothetical protein
LRKNSKISSLFRRFHFLSSPAIKAILEQAFRESPLFYSPDFRRFKKGFLWLAAKVKLKSRRSGCRRKNSLLEGKESYENRYF